VAVRALVFDVFGTLVDWRSGISQAFREAGVPGDPEELADGWRDRYIPILLEVNSGTRPWGDFDLLHHATLDDLLSERELELDAETRERLVVGWHRLDPWPDVRDGLEQLRRDRVVATLSNGHIALLVDLVRHGGLSFDCLLSAELAKAYKPAVEIYQLAPRLLGLQPDEVMLVAAHPGDLWGARRARLRSAFVDRPLEHGPGSPERADPEADHSASDLSELAAQLGRVAS
jgi:2-haloacid dehalogenase